MNDLATFNDEQLIARFARKSDQAALGELARRHERSLLGLACGVLGGRQDLAVDAIQETWIRVIRFAPTFHGRSSFKTWLYRIAINQCRNLRKSQLQESKSRSEADEPDARSPADAILDDSMATTASIEQVEANHMVQREVDALVEDRRLVLLLCYHRGMTHEIAAEILEIPLGTLKSRLHAALGELRERLAVEIEA
jgi:RNA polymerase sigma-70 factor (ECF subfamily)